MSNLSAIEQELASLKVKINEAEQERNQAERKLEVAIEQEKPEYILNKLETLLVSASEELISLRQKEVELMKERQFLIGSQIQRNAFEQRNDKKSTTKPALKIADLDLSKTENVVLLLRHEMDGLAPRILNSAIFLNNCLESKLDRRQTNFELDNKDNIKLLLAVSGAGKTREILELLYMKHGYYFVIGTQQRDVGSLDMTECLNLSYHYPMKVEYYLELLYFVRVFVCNYLMELGYNTPDQILLAQLHPIAFFGVDIFEKLFDSLCWRENINIGRTISKNSEGTRSLTTCFDFIAIDDIHKTMKPGMNEVVSIGGNNRPFFSPLVYYSKRMGMFNHFIVAGAWMNFAFIKELMHPGSMKNDSVYSVELISDLKPLDQKAAEEYIRLILNDHCFSQNDIDEVVNLVSRNEFFLGRNRFLAFILDSIIKEKDVELAINKFVSVLSYPHDCQFPLRVYFADLKNEYNSINRIVGGDTLGSILEEGLIQFMMDGKAKLFVDDQMAEDAIRYGLGFCKAETSIFSVEIEEFAIVEGLRKLIPCSNLVQRMAKQLTAFPKPQMVGLMLEYLVGFAFVANCIPGAAEINSFSGDLAQYLGSSRPGFLDLYFPDHCCGPDIIFKHEKTVYFIQVEFVNKVSKQERLNACNTTDMNKFYWNKKSNTVLKGFEIDRQIILKYLKDFETRRVVFLHTSTNTTKGMEYDIIINQDLAPNFFDNLNPNLWAYLNQLREQFHFQTTSS